MIPPLDPGFRPAALAHRCFDQAVADAGESEPLLLALEREDGRVSRYACKLLPKDHPKAGANVYHAERLLKFLLWQRGAHTVHVAAPKAVQAHLADTYRRGGARHFDYDFLGKWVYRCEFKIRPCALDALPAANEPTIGLGRHLDGCRIGFDLGASDRKVCAVIDGEVVYSEEVVWTPKQMSDPAYHYEEVRKAIMTAAEKLPRVDAIGGSSAGIYVDGQPRIASIFRGVPEKDYEAVRNIFLRIRDEMGVPFTIINDGDVTALAGSMSLEVNGVLGIALGSSEAGGYVDKDGRLTGWLNELAFCPIDYSPGAPLEEWSGDQGVGANYLSQQCVFRLAPAAGITLPEDVSDAERLVSVQKHLEAGHEGAVDIWRTMGAYLGYAVAHYASFYDFGHVLVLGRCTSGSGGNILIEEANRVFTVDFPALADTVNLHLPDEKSRRIGQSIAAASLPALS